MSQFTKEAVRLCCINFLKNCLSFKKSPSKWGTDVDSVLIDLLKSRTSSSSSWLQKPLKFLSLSPPTHRSFLERWPLLMSCLHLQMVILVRPRASYPLSACLEKWHDQKWRFLSWLLKSVPDDDDDDDTTICQLSKSCRHSVLSSVALKTALHQVTHNEKLRRILYAADENVCNGRTSNCRRSYAENIWRRKPRTCGVVRVREKRSLGWCST